MRDLGILLDSVCIVFIVPQDNLGRRFDEDCLEFNVNSERIKPFQISLISFICQWLMVESMGMKTTARTCNAAKTLGKDPRFLFKKSKGQPWEFLSLTSLVHHPKTISGKRATLNMKCPVKHTIKNCLTLRSCKIPYANRPISLGYNSPILGSSNPGTVSIGGTAITANLDEYTQ